jgi:histidinol dehydrogenase
VSNGLENILFSSSDSDFKQRSNDLYRRQLDASLFKIGSDEWKQVLTILREVAEEGDENRREFKSSDEALLGYTDRYDKVKLTQDRLAVLPEELETAHQQIERNLLESLRRAISNVRKYQEEIFIGRKRYAGLKYIPFERVGVCVPGASAPLPSTVIMCAVPAQVAGVKELAVVSPPRYKGDIHPLVLGLCHELGISEVYRVGGAQAVAALACGKGSIPKVDKIVGPGNKWVTTAKKMVSNRYVSIDSVAGPSEVLIIANDKAKPQWVAADMLSQAEHGPGSALLFTDSAKLARAVLEQLKEQVKRLSRAKETTECLEKFSGIVVFKNINEATEQANLFASEHLQIQCGDKSEETASRIRNAGAIFIGDYTPVAVGDYWAGPSHTLPTGRTAKFASALTSNDFIKSISIIEYDKKRLAASAEDIIRLAEAEGLDAHARSVKIRMQ